MAINEKILEFKTWATSHHGRLWRRHELEHRIHIHDFFASLDMKSILNTTVEQARFVVLDLETTGFSVYAGDEIVSVGMIEYSGLQPTGNVFSSLVNPGRSIPKVSSRIHGIYDEDVKRAPTIEDCIDSIAEFISDAVIVGHHVTFDIRFLNKAMQHHLFCRLLNPWVDTMLLYLVQSGRLGHYSLDEVAEIYSVEMIDRHSALGDAKISAEIFTRLLEKFDVAGLPVMTLIDYQNQSHQSDWNL